MRWIGLTGSIGSGKSTVAMLLRRSGYPVAEADVLAHEGLAVGTLTYEEIRNKFGSSILKPDGSIDRRTLGLHVFSHSEDRQWLESLLHPLVQKKVLELKDHWSKSGASMAFYEIPLLFEKNLEGDFDAVVLVTSSEKNQRARLKQRNQWTDAEIDCRLKALLPDQEKIKKAQVIIENEGSLNDLEEKVQRALVDLKALSLKTGK